MVVKSRNHHVAVDRENVRMLQKEITWTLRKGFGGYDLNVTGLGSWHLTVVLSLRVLLSELVGASFSQYKAIQIPPRATCTFFLSRIIILLLQFLEIEMLETFLGRRKPAKFHRKRWDTSSSNWTAAMNLISHQVYKTNEVANLLI
jgi:hypothetical protein